MPDIDPYLDDDYDEEAEEKIKAVMAPLVVTTPLDKPKTGRKKGKTDAELAEELDRLAWETPLAKTADEAKFMGNLGLRFLKGVTTAQINKMAIKDRVNSSRTLFDMKQLLLDKPTVSYSFAERQSVQTVLEKVKVEAERRERERSTIDITPKEGDGWT